jgi:DNA replication and repair protein RecF
MHVTNLWLRDFRNIQQLDFSLRPGTTLLYGPNAAGKTSLLEALFYLATTRSPRLGHDRELIRWETRGEAGILPFARLAAEVQRETSHTPLLLEVVVQLKEGNETSTNDGGEHGHTGTTHKQVRINRKNARAIDLVGLLRVVLFTPADLLLVEGSPNQRRRYLDITLSQIDPPYVRTLSRYNRVVQQRNSLLRAAREQRRPLRAIDSELAYWDEQLATNGGYLLSQRLHAVAELNTLVGPLFQEIAANSEPLDMSYQAGFALSTTDNTDANASTLANDITTALRALRRDELHRGQTLIGPHRDDIHFNVGGVNLGVYGSRGQQRSAAIALKLGETELMRARSGEHPVLLLDDILSELDMQRRAHVLRLITRSHQQTLLSATDLDDFDAAFLQQARCMRVENGHLFES